MEIKITQVETSKKKDIPRDSSKLGFGKYFSDHMFCMEYNPQKGWHESRIEPLRPFSLHPASMVLHYSQQVFEGMKAYKGSDGGVYLFRCDKNIQRLNRSCKRLVIPPLPEDIVLHGLEELVRIEQNWIPQEEGCSLYIRPTVIAVDPLLGVRPSETYKFFILCGPVGAYYPEGFNPVSIFVSDNFIRAAAGGTGEAKTGGNYAASLFAQKEASKAGCSQVLWLDAKHLKFIEEVGTMNIFFRIHDELVTSPLTGSILPGITRDTVLQLARSWNWKVSERLITIEELIEASKNKSLKEMFGCGTAAIISPVKSFIYQDNSYQIADGKIGEWGQLLYQSILDIQYGRADDPMGWRRQVS